MKKQPLNPPMENQRHGYHYQFGEHPMHHLDFIRIYRVPGDRGSVVIDGEDMMRYVAVQPNPCCGRIGHVFYQGSDLVAEHRGRRGKFRAYASMSLGDSVVECVWCGASFAQWEYHAIEDYEERERLFRKDYTKAKGYRVRVETRHE